MNNLKRLRDALLTVLPNATYHFTKSGSSQSQYIVWSEDAGGDQQNADNMLQHHAIQGTVDYFTKTEFDSNYDAIINALNAAGGISFRLNSVQWEEETGFIHYEWIFSVIGS